MFPWSGFNHKLRLELGSDPWLLFLVSNVENANESALRHILQAHHRAPIKSKHGFVGWNWRTARATIIAVTGLAELQSETINDHQQTITAVSERVEQGVTLQKKPDGPWCR